MSSKQRHTRHFPCPLCGHYDEAPRGKGLRCHGWTAGDWTHCSRDEYAGDLGQEDGGTYCHRMTGSCRCGVEHSSRPAPISTGASKHRRPKPTTATVTAPAVVYDYGDFQVCRWGDGPAKVIRQRRPDGRGGHVWNLDGITPHLYRRDELLAAPAGSLVIVNEGEKAVDAIRARGLLATCSPMGAGKWRDEYAQDLRGQVVIIIADHDEPGRRHAADVAASLTDIAARVYVVECTELPEKSDACDYFAAGGTVEGLKDRALTGGEWRPAVPGLAADLADFGAQLAQREERIAALEQENATLLRDLDQSRERCATQAGVITTIERLCESQHTDQKAKLPFIRLTIATYCDARFADAERRPVPIWQEQFAAMLGGVDPKTARTAMQTMAAENLCTLIKEPTGKTITYRNGRRGPQERYAIQLGADPDREPVSLATWRELMCRPKDAAKRKVRKDYTRRCQDHPDADLCRDWKCSRCGKLVYQDVVPPQQETFLLAEQRTGRRSGKYSPATGGIPGKLSASDLALPPAPRQPAPAAPDGQGGPNPQQESFLLPACACGTLLARGQDCPRCDDRACRECGALTGSALRTFCPGRCRNAVLEQPVYLGPPAELLRDYGERLAGNFPADGAAAGGA